MKLHLNLQPVQRCRHFQVQATRLIQPYLSEFEAGAQLIADDSAGSRTVAIFVKDFTSRRIVEAAATHLGLVAALLDWQNQTFDALGGYELIVADPDAAQAIHVVLGTHEQSEGVAPALVVTRLPETEAGKAEGEETHDDFDGVLTLPAQPAQVTAQLSLILYAHRSFARRYRTALEELHLNRRIFRSVTSGISIANAALPDLPLTYVNPAFEVMTGYSLEDVQGRNCRFLQGSETSQPEIKQLRDAIREEREIVVILQNFRKDGTPFWNEFSLSPIRNREGMLTHFVGIQSDITARVEFEAALRESEKLAAVGRLASSIAHEINNPLESVMNLLYLAQGEQDPAEAIRYVAMADKEVQRVALITSQSLRFYKQSTRPQTVSPNELLDAVLDLYEGKAENSSVVIERRFRGVKPIICLESEIRQVLNNLVRNALDAMHGRGGRLLIRTRDARHAGTGEAGVLITVADTGTGISPATQQQMYKPFFTTKGIAGTGLGLWISSEIITRHGGVLHLRSCQQPSSSGTVFTLFLPARTVIAPT